MDSSGHFYPADVHTQKNHEVPINENIYTTFRIIIKKKIALILHIVTLKFIMYAYTVKLKYKVILKNNIK